MLRPAHLCSAMIYGVAPSAALAKLTYTKSSAGMPATWDYWWKGGFSILEIVPDQEPTLQQACIKGTRQAGRPAPFCLSCRLPPEVQLPSACHPTALHAHLLRRHVVPNVAAALPQLLLHRRQGPSHQPGLWPH